MRKIYTRRITPARQCPKVTVILEPGLRQRLEWLAEAQHISLTALTEKLIDTATAPQAQKQVKETIRQ